MDWFLFITGILLISFGAWIWRYKHVRWLSNLPNGPRVKNTARAARIGGSYLIFIGLCFTGFGYVVKGLTQHQLALIVACFIPINMIVLISYLVAQSKNMH